MKKAKILLGLILFTIIMLSLNVNSAFVLKKTSDDINAYKNHNLVRLHVIAHSNSSKDQYIKRIIRDKIQVYMHKISSIKILKSKKELSKLKEYIENILVRNDYSYLARVEYGTYYFPLRTYDDITLPPGEYKALRVVLGKGEGSNWWCVLLPPMCIENKDNSGKSNLKLEIRFKSLEWLNRKGKVPGILNRILKFDWNLREKQLDIAFLNNYLGEIKNSFADEIYLARIIGNSKNNQKN